MKTSRGFSLLRHVPLALAATVFAIHSARGGSITLGDPVTPAGGISYEWTALLGANDSVQFSRWVGAWSWEDDDLSASAGFPVGWTHASDFVAVTLTEAQTLTIRVERFATPFPFGGTASIASMNPSFTLWSGWDNDGGESHQYQNNTNISWASVAYVGHVKNSSEAVAEASFVLGPGQYTIAIGSNAPADDADDQGYQATLTTSVPEPSAALSLLSGAFLIARRRKRAAR